MDSGCVDLVKAAGLIHVTQYRIGRLPQLARLLLACVLYVFSKSWRVGRGVISLRPCKVPPSQVLFTLVRGHI